MATLSTGARNAACNAITALCNVTGPGKIKFRTAGDVVVATLTFSATAFGAASVGVAAAASITADTNAVGGTFTKATLEDGAGAIAITCTANNTGGEFNMSNNVVAAADTVTVSSLTVTVPAS